MIRLFWIFLLGSFMFLINAVQCQPSGTLKIGKDNFYFDRTEVTNIGWQEFLYYQKNKFGENSKEYTNNFPDTIIWAKAYKGERFFSNRNKYSKFPVVGVTKTQAENYCKFRSEAVTKIYGKKVVYSLPSKSDYTLVINRKKSVYIQSANDYCKVKKNKIYGLCDKVSEILSDENLAFGNHINESDKRCSVIEFKAANQYTGFRCKATVQK